MAPLESVQILLECELCAICCVCLYTYLLTFRQWTVFPVVKNPGSMTSREREVVTILKFWKVWAGTYLCFLQILLNEMTVHSIQSRSIHVY